MKAILISIKPKWVAKILNGEKTIEVRKSKPKCDLPIDVYIYCTKGEPCFAGISRSGKYTMLNGKVVAKFTLNKIEEMINPCFPKGTFATRSLNYETFLKQSCLTEKELDKYINKGNRGYAWHISNLVIFDKPKELGEFHKVGWEEWCKTTSPIKFFFEPEKCREELEKFKLTKAPQSYQFIEVGGDK